ncbi:helix-turn-helix domain-containing protein [Dermatobacter hominis]|uniref:helix-turn-helix domain-containing protein n=1 Tax=Dermatobacter hominis TaxID=2884263 RepID=UPI001D0F6609|nr:helix-turn-helix domain-containing protein [Dermatobacter hominis]UDY37783.1 helix-turn-helix domain-containing protein [Dermatobacter hominis]
MGDDRVLRPERLRKAHLADPADVSHTMSRYAAPDDLADLLQWYWVPVWSVPAGQRSEQRVLQYPCALIVITQEYARFYGVVTGMSSTELQGDGWAVGSLLQPAAGSLVAGRTMSELTDAHVELADLLGERGATLAATVRSAMDADGPAGWAEPEVHARATGAVSTFLREHLPVDDEGRLVNELVARVERDDQLVRVSQLAEAAACSERSLQRLLRRRLGLTPKWLIQRRRLQDLSLRLREREEGETLASLAAELGYADEAHLVRDFRTVTGWTPARFGERFGPPA